MSGNQPGGFLIVFPFGEFPNTWDLAEKTGWPRESAFLKEANPLGPREANMLIKSAVAQADPANGGEVRKSLSRSK